MLLVAALVLRAASKVEKAEVIEQVKSKEVS